MNWTRLISTIAGAAPAIASLVGILPPKVGVPLGVGGAFLAGLATNAEKFLAKRKAGAPTFNTMEAEAAVARMKAEGKEPK